MSDLDNNYSYSFPAVRGQQAGKPFYIATCPLRLIPRIFVYDEEEVPVELRAQRTLNKNRIPEMAKYLVDSPKDYVFSAITASVGAEVSFVAADSSSNLGMLKVPMDAQILINDGQHRRAAIEEAIKERPELCQDNIAVLFFVDEGLKRSQQMFADLNKYAVRPSASLSTLYDHRDQAAELARYLALECEPFIGFTEFERSTIASKSSKLFTLSGIKQANKALFGKGTKEGFSETERKVAVSFWRKLNQYMPEWLQVQNKQLSAAELRQEYICAHGIGLQALAIVGHDLLKLSESHQSKCYNQLQTIDWRKANPAWKNRAMNHGRLSKAVSNIFLTAIEIKKQIGLTPSAEELAKEKELLNT
ncbi:DNA sulfur modification protein DndB [Pseudoalteromonas ruthenica]|uniref:DNA sulfur modification protein DndB n=1 Tax=Pseudoalteromonas ruthenica TaxID=151081 RepID=A0A0F4PNR7_9GAMM|nr:DNA sulfur modification protein DndB [Pseudoalteromonas ruthenica]KJY95881.1 DNA sulfur modification protein DndB [Pseudoalteromonas ruthenica]KJZ00231.1 DNA sulfur modification protein DndB [Pseudoalteromonas ruthenica]TMO49992.1 DNA sulfur modification protein DndB [Pseudoalteromonas ruthenica]TMO52368.1 DNA sulfur modification protein DndB [Pseudoalteromonas ruthenica]TMO91866.1 DNA sulfur modification protein DndB [Pseudoalteromonas ruthenica]